MVSGAVRFALVSLFLLITRLLLAEDIKFECPKGHKSPKDASSRSEVYKNAPFQPGESARYELRYVGALVGYGNLDVRIPLRYKNRWQRVFHAEAKTGDWYKYIFVGHDKIEALSDPADFSINKYYLEQDEGKIFGSRLQQKKWLEYDHMGCKVFEKTQRVGKPELNETFDLYPSAVDSLGVVYTLRTRAFQLNKAERIPVYTSQKNWWLEATPIAQETITVPAGVYQTWKIKLQTFIGQHLEQKGDVFIWIDKGTPERPLVKLEGKVKIGHIKLELVNLTKGTPI